MAMCTRRLDPNGLLQDVASDADAPLVNEGPNDL